MDELKVTLTYCPRCLWYPFHGAKERSLCCGLPFETKTYTIRGALVRRFVNVPFARALGGQWFNHNKVYVADLAKLVSREPERGGYFFKSLEDYDKYQEARKLMKQHPWSKEWAISQYT